MSEISERLVELDYNFEEIGPSIFLIRDFFSDSDLAPFWEIINNARQADWEEDYRQSQVALAIRKYGRSDIENLINEGIMEYTYEWSDKAISVPRAAASEILKRVSEIFSFMENAHVGVIDTIQRQYEGASLVEHVDSHGDPSVLYAIVGYMNDDYLGGELFFPRLGLELKPPAKSLIIFPDGEQYSHGVRAPGAGPVRYALPTFVTKL